MDNIFVIAGIIALIFLIVKFIEMRFVEKESKPLKYLIRDSLLVYFSVIFGNFVFEQVSPIGDNARVTPVFTGNPDF
jgi:TctA family transporter